MFCCFRKDSKKRKIQMLLHHLDVPKSAAVSLVLCLKLTLLFLMQFSSFVSFNIWMCICAEASLSPLNSCFCNCYSRERRSCRFNPANGNTFFKLHNKPVQDHSQWTAAGGLLLVCFLLPLPPSSRIQHKFSGILVRACASDTGS